MQRRPNCRGRAPWRGESSPRWKAARSRRTSRRQSNTCLAFAHILSLIEVVADLESTVRELRRPIDTGALRRCLADAPIDTVGPLGDMAKTIRPDTLIPRLFATNKSQAIDELLAALRKAGLVTNAETARDAIWNRERSLSTGLEHGVAIPHGRTDAVDSLVCAVGLAPQGIAFDSSDDQPAQIIVLTLSPTKAPTPHVQFIARISQGLNPEGRMLMLACHTPEEMAAVLTGGMTDRTGSLLGNLRRRLTPSTHTAASLSSQFVRPSLVVPRLHASTVEEAIAELLEVAKKQGVLRNVAVAQAAVLSREQQSSTGLGHGVAIPHARTDAVDHLFCVVGRSPHGIDFRAPDGEAARIIVLAVSPLPAAEPQVRLMAHISRALDSSGRTRILAADTAEEIAAALTSTATA